MIRRWLAACLVLVVTVIAAPDARPASQPDATGVPGTPDQAFADAMRQSIGAPGRAELGTEAAVRLDEGLLIIPRAAALRLLQVTGRAAPSDLLGLLVGSPGLEVPGYVRFVPAGYIDANAALAWTPDDMLDSLRDTIERQNADLLRQNLPEREARRWIRAPRYNAELHTLSWAALVLPKDAPRESDGEIVFHGLSFGRDGYIEVTVRCSEEQARDVGAMVDSFLLGVAFLPGRTYLEHQATDPSAPAGLAGAMGIDTLHGLRDHGSLWSSELLLPAAGSLVALIGATALFLYVHRHLRRRARRV